MMTTTMASTINNNNQQQQQYTNLHPAFPFFRLISVQDFIRCGFDSENKSDKNEQKENKYKHVSGILLVCFIPDMLKVTKPEI